MRILVIGRSGQVARSLASMANPAAAIETLGRPQVDITNRSRVCEAVESRRPDLVVNAAAYTAVDQAESEPEAAYAVNRDGAAHVAEAAFRLEIPVVHISTDYVFSGDKSEPYNEDDAPEPKGVYGASKLAGERAVAEANPAHAIFRTAWVYSPHGRNFVKTMLRLAGERDRLTIVADQQGTPTYAPDIAAGILAAGEHMIAGADISEWAGLYHMVAGGETTWAGFAEAIFRQSAAEGGPSASVEPITTAEFPTPARRPANSRLDTTRLAERFGVSLPHWEDGLARCMQALRAG